MSDTAAADPPDALPRGTRLGEFELLRVLGVGGFGIVYLAFDHSLEREVAIKEYMPAALAGRTATLQVWPRSPSDAEVFALGLRSFVNEARLLARFDHPSLLKVHRFWEANGTAYMAMPVYRGRTLKQLRATLTAPPTEAAVRALLEPLLGALERLHAEGVFHRDIAPDNIIVEADGRPVLLDFGAARRVIGDRTQDITAVLKPAYAPIEQYAESGAVRQGPWTDFYALGATMHQLLLGQAPPPATARALSDEQTPLAARALPGCSAAFLQAIDWMLAPRPADRPQDVAMLREALAGRRLPPLPAGPVPRASAQPGQPKRSALDQDARAAGSLAPSARVAPDPALPPTADPGVGLDSPAAAPSPMDRLSEPGAGEVGWDLFATADDARAALGATSARRAKAQVWRSGTRLGALGVVATALVAAGAVLALRLTPVTDRSAARTGTVPTLTASATDAAPAQGDATLMLQAPAAGPSPLAAGDGAEALPRPSALPTLAVPAPVPMPLPTDVRAAGAGERRAAPATGAGAAQRAAQLSVPPAHSEAPPARPPPTPPSANTTPSWQAAPQPRAMQPTAPVTLAQPVPADLAAPAPTSRATAQLPLLPTRSLPSVTAPAPAAPAPPATAAISGPQTVCGGLNPLLHFVCMERECLRSALQEHADCLQWRRAARPSE